MRTLITLFTDFGTADGYVAEMKGVLYELAPTADVVDLSHDVPAHAVEHARLALARYWRRFPTGTIHLVVVDPGVGSERAALAVASEGRFLVGPDNGVLSPALLAGDARAVRLMVPPHAAPTFHGRDVFAPAAAHLARGVSPARFGNLIQDHLKADFARPERTGKRTWAGCVLKVDRFGNLITNFHVDDFPTALERPRVLLAGVRGVEKAVENYAEGGFGEPVVIAGSSGYLEVAVNQGSAAKLLGCVAGSVVELSIY